MSIFKKVFGFLSTSSTEITLPSAPQQIVEFIEEKEVETELPPTQAVELDEWEAFVEEAKQLKNLASANLIEAEAVTAKAEAEAEAIKLAEAEAIKLAEAEAEKAELAALVYEEAYLAYEESVVALQGRMKKAEAAKADAKAKAEAAKAEATLKAEAAKAAARQRIQAMRDKLIK
jgi:membrane protein involved in colicin uptake